jgi:hypothetical protein
MVPSPLGQLAPPTPQQACGNEVPRKLWSSAVEHRWLHGVRVSGRFPAVPGTSHLKREPV